jgi:hypothetical protein
MKGCDVFELLPPDDPHGQVSKWDVGVARRIVQVRDIQRRANIAAWNDYIGFVVSKSLGFCGLVVGGLEYLDPNLLSIVLKNPLWIAGAGLAMLTGKNLLTLIAKLERGIK